jgi:hypothetical protein
MFFRFGRYKGGFSAVGKNKDGVFPVLAGAGVFFRPGRNRLP